MPKTPNQPSNSLKTLLMPTKFFPLLVASPQKLKDQKIDLKAVRNISKLYSPYNKKIFGNHSQLVVPVVFDTMVKLAIISLERSKITIFNLQKSSKVSKDEEKMEDKLVYACLVKYLEKVYNREVDQAATLREGFSISYGSCTRSTNRNRAITNLAFFAFLVMTGSSDLVATD